MKFISQHIYDLISRFRNDVYLEDISSGTIASGGNLGLDSNNKIVKASAAGGISFDGSTANGILTYKDSDEATVEGELTYDSETLTIGADDNGLAYFKRLANASGNGGRLFIVSGDGSGTNAAGGNLTLSGGKSTGNAAGGSIVFHSSAAGSSGSSVNSLDEIAAFDNVGNLQLDGGITTGSTSFVNSSGVIQVAGQTNITGLGTITTGTWQGTSIGTTYTDAKVTSIVAGDGIDVSGATGDVTVTAETATDSNPGVVELATTGEADTGTDTARAVTPAGLKSHVDARYHYQYIPLSANATTPSDGDWMYASGNGIGNHLYNQNGGAGGTTASNTDGSASTITISKNAISGGIMIPYDCILVGFYAQTRSNADKQQAVGIFTGQPIWNDYINITAYLRGYSAQDISAGPDTSYSVRAVRHEVLNINYSLSAGECIWYCLKDLSGSGGGIISSATIVLKTLNP